MGEMQVYKKGERWMQEVTLQQVRVWNLRRLGLLDKFATAVEAVTSLVAVQAQDQQAAQLAVQVRTHQPFQLEAALQPGGDLLRLWTLRGTLHLLHREDAYLHQAATAEEWLTRWGRYVERYLPVPREEAVRHIYPRIAAVLDDQPKTLQDISDLVQLPPEFERLHLHYMKDLCYLGYCTRGWDRRGKATFYAADYPGRGSVSPQEAQVELLRCYIRTYGPVSAQDMAYWSGWRASVVHAALTVLLPELVVIRVADQPMVYYLQRDQLDELLAIDPAATLPAEQLFLPAYDVLLLAYRDKRRFLADESRQQVFLSAARALPVVLEGGQVVGTWNQQTGAVRRFG